MPSSPYRPDRKWTNHTPVREPDRERSRWMWTLMCGIVAAMAPLVFYLMQTNRYVETGYRLEQLRESLSAIAETERHLSVTCTTLETPPRVERAARKLGLHRPSTESLVIVQVGSPAPVDLMARAPDSGDPNAR
jgi:hypothetical protein